MKTLILCNGHPPTEELFWKSRKWAEFFIAADGGGNVARSFNSLPDVVVGDLDSFEHEADDPFEIIFDPNQEANDLEKALTIAQREQAREVMILGATGYRLDQTLKNLSVLKQFNPYFDHLFMKDDFGETFLIPPSFSISLPAGTLVSLFPLSGVVKGITTQGLKFPLKSEALQNGVRDGSSNEVTGSPVEITYKKGDLLLFVGN